jgi:hypothetical protein
MRDRYGFWIWDSEYRQRRDIEQSLGREDVLESNMASLSASIGGLRKEVEQLYATIGVLVQMLAEANQIDPKVLGYRIEAALDEAHAQPAARPKAPSTEMPATITCVLCKRAVPPATTIMTADGPRCDPACV